MSSQRTTGHREDEMSSSYVDLAGRETIEISAYMCLRAQWPAALRTWEQPPVYGNEVGGALSSPGLLARLLLWKEAKGNSTGG